MTYLLITLIVVFGHAEDLLGTTLLGRPLVLGPLVGWVLGDIQQGVIMGATLELIFMGNIKVGAAIPPDVITGGVLGTTFAILSGKGAAIALALAIPISILAEMLLSGLFVFRSLFNKRFMAYAEAGDYRGIQRLHIISGLIKPLLMGAMTWLSLSLGADAMKSFLDMIPSWVNAGLTQAGNMLPALGFALLMNLMFKKSVAPYFFLGFILAAFVRLPVIAIGGLGVIIALLVTARESKPAPVDEEGWDDEAATPTPPGVVSTLPPYLLRKLFYRSLALEANFNFETWQNTGFAFCIIPVLKKLYHGKQAMSAALRRHLQFFNTSTYGSTLILGITAAMEEQYSRDEHFDESSINSVKLGLMGPLAGVFDSLFWGTLKVIAAGVGTSLALKGHITGAILFVLLFNVPHLLLRYRLTFIGYRTGTKFLQNLAQNNVMDRLTLGASIMGLMVVGAMPATLMSIKTGFTLGDGASAVTLQNVLDQIVPAMIPLALTFAVYYFVKKGVKTTYLLLGLLALGLVSGALHLFV